MRILNILLYSATFILIIHCSSSQHRVSSYSSPQLEIKEINKHVFIHTSFLESTSFGKVACNGMIVIDKGEALIFDTPVNDSASEELLNWVKDSLHCKVKGVVVNHFHVDCLGGLARFHKKGISSYGSARTIHLAKLDSTITPWYSFDTFAIHQVGNKKIISHFVGEGHTSDNIISYVPSEKIMFGGCLIKHVGAGKGNLEHANTSAWSNSVRQIKLRYSQSKIIIPGHGAAGGQELLDYTIALFEKE